MNFQQPDLLKSGDLLKVVAPSGALKEYEAFERGLEVWRSRGYRLELTDNWDDRHGYLAGKDGDRRQALKEAWLDPECKGILCARGGYGSMRLLEDWHWLLEKPKWIIGFSDITGLLWSLAKEGIIGLHAPVLTTIAIEPDWSLARLFNYLETGELPPLEGTVWVGGKVKGRLIAANLTVATHLLGTKFQPDLDGAILALEDVGEAPYRIDRMLTQWRLSGIVDRLGGIALGRFSNCDAPIGVNSWTIEEVLRDRLSDLGIPVVANLPFGHDGVNAILPVGQLFELDGDAGVLKTCSLQHLTQMGRSHP
jgi:muramoyltetrapeptide carboxypeptidase